jgi:phage shock protein PspC (stress-responsive transcriptional regulator)
MNEVTRIHLGRQPFVIAVDAHKQLRDYLDAIKEAVGKQHKEVIKEVELRMAELLTERSITGEKTILPEDVVYLKEQLGQPKDFASEESENTATPAGAEDEQQPQKRLFRDKKNGMVAGVSAGLATFFNIDVVIVRLVFILLTILWGWGALLYIILWIVVPAAKTSSDRLLMRGKPVTVDNLNKIVRTELAAASERAGKAGKATSNLINSAFKWTLMSLGFILASIATLSLFALAAGAGYMFTHQDGLVAGLVSFPIGGVETTFAVSALAAAGLVLLGVFLAGAAMMRRKWPLAGWATAAIVGLFLTASTVGGVTAPDTFSRLEDRYNAAERTLTRETEEFNKVRIIGGELSFRYQESDEYKVEIRYFGRQNTETLKTDVRNNELTIDGTRFTDETGCNKFCIDWDEYSEATIYAPDLDSVTIDGHTIMRVENGERFRAPFYY